MHDANIRVAIAGAGGRMGRQLIQAALALEGVQLGAALEREGSSLLGSDAGELAGAGKTGVTVQSSLDAVKDDFDVYRFYPSGRYAEPSRFLSPAWQRDGDRHYGV
ncbi:dihydrodipicolinate reductase, family protein [Escherichia coli DEC8B]|nr:dihydrodipicolinate reductase, family protein [Escherichia coli DEC8B]